MTRKCGSCSLCCTALSVAEIDKAAGEPCPYLAPEGGCGIYEDRPEACRVFRCAWLAGHFGDLSTRPDRLGAVLHIEDGGFGPQGQTLVIYIEPGSRKWSRSRFVAKTAARFWAEDRVVFVVEGEEKHQFAPRNTKFWDRIERAQSAQED